MLSTGARVVYSGWKKLENRCEMFTVAFSHAYGGVSRRNSSAIALGRRPMTVTHTKRRDTPSQ
eukprot:3529991-Prymnesium_polylepis.2